MEEHDPISTVALNTSRDSLRSELITAVQFAQLLNVSERTLYRLKSSGKLPTPIVLGGLVRWRVTEVHQWIDQGCPPNSDFQDIEKCSPLSKSPNN
jgi:excisionase family DNA binding protein